MMTLLQLINRMIVLEFKDGDIRETIAHLQDGSLQIETLYRYLNLEMPAKNSVQITRLFEVLKKHDRVEAALNVCLMAVL